MSSSPSMIILFALRTLSRHYASQEVGILTQFTPGSDHRQVTVGAQTVNLDCIKDVIESLGEKLRSTAISIFCFTGQENEDARNNLTKMERKGLLVLEKLLKGELFVQMHQPGREDSSSAVSSAASFHVIAGGGGEGDGDGDGEGEGDGDEEKEGEGDEEKEGERFIVWSSATLLKIFTKMLEVKTRSGKNDFLSRYCDFLKELFVLTTISTCSRAGSELASAEFADIIYLNVRSTDAAVQLMIICRAIKKWNDQVKTAVGISGALASLLITVSNAMRRGITKACEKDIPVTASIKFRTIVFITRNGELLSSTGQSTNKLFETVVQETIDTLDKPYVTCSQNAVRHAYCLLLDKIAAKKQADMCPYTLSQNRLYFQDFLEIT